MLKIADNHTRNVVITGGAGFIGANLASHLLATMDARITLYDNLSRPGSEDNVAWLRTHAGAARLRFYRGDVRHTARVMEVMRHADEIYHCAARCSSGTAADLRTDYAVNVTGTINVLEAARRSGRRPMVFFASTSKVYGDLKSVEVMRDATRYRAVDPAFRGISEQMPVDYHSPVSCSKGAAERHVLGYARVYGLPTVVLRLDTIAGPRQFPTGAGRWLARFVAAVMTGNPVPIHGDGLQVRDVLHAADLVAAMEAARAYIGITAGKVYNVGGCISRAVSVQEMLSLIECVAHRAARVRFGPWEPGDPLLYVSDNSAFSHDTGWMPRRSLEQTVRDAVASWNAYQLETSAAPSVAGTSFREAA